MNCKAYMDMVIELITTETPENLNQYVCDRTFTVDENPDGTFEVTRYGFWYQDGFGVVGFMNNRLQINIIASCISGDVEKKSFDDYPALFKAVREIAEYRHPFKIERCSGGIGR